MLYLKLGYFLHGERDFHRKSFVGAPIFAGLMGISNSREVFSKSGQFAYVTQAARSNPQQ